MSEGPCKTIVYPNRKGKERVNTQNQTKIQVPILVVFINTGLGTLNKEAHEKKITKEEGSPNHTIIKEEKSRMLNIDKDLLSSTGIDIKSTVKKELQKFTQYTQPTNES